MSFAAKKEFRKRFYYFHKAGNIIPCNARKSMISNAEGLPGKAIDGSKAERWTSQDLSGPEEKSNNLGVWTKFSGPLGYRAAMFMKAVGWKVTVL